MTVLYHDGRSFFDAPYHSSHFQRLLYPLWSTHRRQLYLSAMVAEPMVERREFLALFFHVVFTLVLLVLVSNEW